jgi:hypothetical protein
MVSIGKLGTDREEIEADFDYFGETIRVNPDASEAVAMRFAVQASDIDVDNNPGQAMVATVDFLRSLIHPEDMDRFLEIAVKKRQRNEDLLTVASSILEAVSGFPTTPRSDSSDGPPRTGTTSTAVPSWQELRHRFENDGRPDLALALVQAAEIRGDVPVGG